MPPSLALLTVLLLSLTEPTDLLANDPKEMTDQETSAIMAAARSVTPLQFDGYKITLLPDLARRNLQPRRTLKPLLDALRDRNVLYRWGYPFALYAHKEEKTATFRKLGDLLNMLSTFGLPMIALPDWPWSSTLLDPPRFEEWQVVSKRRIKSNSPRSAQSSSPSTSVTSKVT